MIENKVATITTASGDSPIVVFARDLLSDSNKELRVIRCDPIDLPCVLKTYKMGLLASTSKGNFHWRTIDLYARRMTYAFVENDNNEESILDSCAPVALRELGLPVTQKQIVEYSKNYNSTAPSIPGHPEISGHVMAFKEKDGLWILTDQYGECKVNDRVITHIAKFRKKHAPNAPQGYLIQEKFS